MRNDCPQGELQAEVEGAQAWPGLDKWDGQNGVNDDCAQEAYEAWKQAGSQICPVSRHLILRIILKVRDMCGGVIEARQVARYAL